MSTQRYITVKHGTVNSYPSHYYQKHNNHFLPISRMLGFERPILTHFTDVWITTTNSYPSEGFQDYINQLLSISQISGIEQLLPISRMS